jgi:TPR repeat protein
MSYLKIKHLKLILTIVILCIIGLSISLYYKSQPNYQDDDYYSIFSDGCDPIRKLYFTQHKIREKIDAEKFRYDTAEWDEQYAKNMEQFKNEGGFLELEDASYSNDSCGAKSAMFLKMEYEKLSMEDEKDVVHERLESFAEQNNPWAIYPLCGDIISGELSKKSLAYCQKYIELSDEHTPLELMDMAYILIAIEESKNNLEQSFKTCELIHDVDTKGGCYAMFSNITDELNDEENIELSYYHEKVIDFFEEFDYPLYQESFNSNDVLKKTYAKITDWDKLIALCKESDEFATQSCMSDVYLKAKDLYSKEKFKESTLLFKSLLECGDQCDSDEVESSAFYLGESYLFGNGVNKDSERAIRLYRIALKYASDNFKSSDRKAFYLRKISSVYFSSNDYVSSSIYTRRCAELGNAECQGFLGLLYMDGKGVPKDQKEAYAWLGIATAQGLTEKESTYNYAKMRDLLAAVILEQGGVKELNAAKEIEKEYYQKYVIDVRRVM